MILWPFHTLFYLLLFRCIFYVFRAYAYPRVSPWTTLFSYLQVNFEFFLHHAIIPLRVVVDYTVSQVSLYSFELTQYVGLVLGASYRCD